MSRNKIVVLGSALAGLLFATGCAVKELQPLRADGTYCHKAGRDPRPVMTCTPGAVPSAAADLEAKKFEGTVGALTVFVVRKGWSDETSVVTVTIDGTAQAHTVPDSMVRLRLKPGAHRLSAQTDGQPAEVSVDGGAGEVRAVALSRVGAAWGNRIGWDLAETAALRASAQSTRLVADLDLSR